MIRQFYDADDGGFFFTAHDHEALIHRPKPTLDESSPAGNGTAACALIALGHLFADTRYLDAASGTLRALRGAVEQYPAGHCTLLSAVEANAYAPEQIIVRGPVDALGSWLDIAREGYRPWRQVYGIPYRAADAPDYLPQSVDSGTGSRLTAFVCRGLECSPPIDSIEEFRSALS